ncbi:MAG TPA: GNAT family N-acetyltransferase [Gemmatimonadaceae bacterium]|nr:GNAT family N-acetyltransferase [Gemmatimonadaceae bacterium]
MLLPRQLARSLFTTQFWATLIREDRFIMTPFAVAPLRAYDRDAWETLARGYHTFYEEAWPPETYARVWERLREDREIHALGAYQDDRLVGFVHYLFHGHVWQPAVCYLQDLFVAESLRGSGVGRAMIAQVEQIARNRGACRVYWLTKHDNERARRLYDKVATYSGFIRYEDPL